MIWQSGLKQTRQGKKKEANNGDGTTSPAVEEAIRISFCTSVISTKSDSNHYCLWSKQT